MDLHALAPLCRLPAPVVTWYIATEPAEDTAAQLDIVRKNGLRELAHLDIGGWAAKRFEQSVQESWERSAARVATLIDDVARRTDPAVVVGSGDDRAITLLEERLPAAVRERFVAVPGGGRHADGSAEEVRRHVAEAVAAKAASEEVEVLERFAEARGRGEGAVEGVGQVVRALQQGNGLGALLRFETRPPQPAIG